MAAEQTRPVTGSGLGPAFAAVRVRLGLVLALFALAAVGWWWTVGQMQGMDEGPWTSLGAFGWFLGVWVVMMAAMMFPSVAPTVALYSRMTKTRLPLAPAAFTAGYLLTWAAAGVAAWTIAMGISQLTGDALAWGNAGRCGRRGNRDRRGGLRAHPAEGRLPRQVPQPAGVPAGLLARRVARRPADGS